MNKQELMTFICWLIRKLGGKHSEKRIRDHGIRIVRCSRCGAMRYPGEKWVKAI